MGSQRNDSAEADTGFATQGGRIMGSLPLMSPEQFTAPSEVTVVSDVYSFGVVLYEMLTGRLLYVASCVAERVQRMLHEVPVSLSGKEIVPT